MDKIWLKNPEPHDFPAAIDYLELLFTPDESKKFADNLKIAVTITKKAKDVLRASNLPLLPQDNIHVKQDLKKVKKEQKLSPILLVRYDHKLIIADGYHRICALYYLSEDHDIPCRLV
jgi:hypothetical protein